MRRDQMRFGWINRDGKLIIAVRGVRTFAHSAASVLLAIYLDLQGFGLLEIGLFLTIGSAGAVFWALVAGLVGDRLGRRRLLTVMGLLSALTGVALITSQSLQLLAAAAFLGSFSALTGASGAMGPLEQASLPATAAPERRTDVFALYGIVGTAVVSLGALAAGLPSIFQSAFGIDQVAAFQVVFGVYVLLSLIAALCYSQLSPRVEVASGPVRAESGVLLVLHALRHPASGAGPGVFCLPPADGDLPVGGGPPRQSDRPGEHHGLHAHPLQPAPDRHPVPA
jgi:MFS family permease